MAPLVPRAAPTPHSTRKRTKTKPVVPPLAVDDVRKAIRVLAFLGASLDAALAASDGRSRIRGDRKARTALSEAVRALCAYDRSATDWARRARLARDLQVIYERVRRGPISAREYRAEIKRAVERAGLVASNERIRGLAITAETVSAAKGPKCAAATKVARCFKVKGAGERSLFYAKKDPTRPFGIGRGEVDPERFVRTALAAGVHTAPAKRPVTSRGELARGRARRRGLPRAVRIA